LKIFYISASDIPSHAANSIHVVKMCQALASSGHEVVLTVCMPSGLDAGKVISEAYGIAPLFRVMPVNVPKITGFSYIHGLWSAARIRGVSPDLVFTRSLHAAVLAAALGWPVLFEAHSPMSDTGTLNDGLFRWLVRRPSFLGLVVITQSLKEHYLAYSGLNKESVYVAPDGADSVVPPEPAFQNATGRLQVGYVGHLYPGKGMEVIAPLAKQAPWADFTIVGGSGEALEYWRGQCEGLPNIRFLGPMPHGKVPEYLASFDVVLLPNQLSVKSSQGKRDIGRWTSPLKAFEYMAAGKPILASDIPVLREVLNDGENALLCAPNDVSIWAQALARLRDEPDFRAELGHKAKQIFEAKYTWSSRARNIVEFASNVLKGDRA
jgi:glycosyltransferase involved in cell wall biosynthesis